MTRGGIYVGWLGFANLGDEAMWQICRTRYPAVEWVSYGSLLAAPNVKAFVGKGASSSAYIGRVLKDEFITLSRTRAACGLLRHKLAVVRGGEVGLLGGGTIINAATYGSYVDVRRRTKSVVPVFGSGVHTPAFWGRYPGWTDTRKMWAKAFEELPVVGVRGPLSKELLEDAGAGNVVIAGDPAVRYFEPRLTYPQREKPRVGINCGDFNNRVWGEQSSLIAALARLAEDLQANGAEVVLIPVFPKDVAICVEIAKSARMCESAVSPVLTSAAEYMRAVGALDLVVASRLHAAILAAAASVPVLVLEYQPKCLDFALSIGWQDFTVRTDALERSVLTATVLGMLSQLDSLRARLQTAMVAIARTFECYCQQIEPLLLK